MSSIMASGRTLPGSTICCIHKLKVVANGFDGGARQRSKAYLGEVSKEGGFRLGCRARETISVKVMR